MKLPTQNIIPPDRVTLSIRQRFNPTKNTTAAVTSPKPNLNLFLAARNNAGVADQFFKNRLRFASIGQALTTSEVIQYYQLIQALQDSFGRAV